MTSYAVLGATGSTGSSLVKVLRQREDVSIHAFVRSKAKLARTIPGIEDDPRVDIFEGDITRIDVLTECIRNTRACFMAVALNENMPGCSIAQDSTKAVLAALQRLREKDPACKLPLLVVLSSSSLSEHLSRDLPKIAHQILLLGAGYVYDDLREAEKLLRAQEHWGVKSVFIKPGGLVHDAQKGHELSTGRQQTFLSFLDLAAGMVEVADAREGTWDMQDVSVVPTSKEVKIEWWVPWIMLKGLMYHFLPWLWPLMHG